MIGNDQNLKGNQAASVNQPHYRESQLHDSLLHIHLNNT